MKRHPSIDTSDSGDDRVEEVNGETKLHAITTETSSLKTNIVLSIPSEIKGESFPPVDPKTRKTA